MLGIVNRFLSHGIARSSAKPLDHLRLDQQQQRRWVARVRLKWVKNRGLDCIIDRETDVKAACLLVDAIARSPSGVLPARSLAPFQKHLGLTVPVLRFLRRYPTLFSEAPHPRFPSLPTFSLAPAAHLLRDRELSAYQDAGPRLARLLMMTRSRALPLSSVYSLRYDLGLPPDFPTALSSAHPDLFRLGRRPHDGAPLISLASWPDELAVSALQLRHRDAIEEPSYRNLKKPPSSLAALLAFPMRFPRGYGSMKKVKAWMEEFHRLPYVSPYDDPSGIEPESDLMEKRVVGVLHELLSITIHKKTKRNYLRSLREELSLPQKFTRIFTRFPGIFYLSLKCKTTTVVLREGYEKGKLVERHPLAAIRDKYHYVMRTGLLYRGKGTSKLVLDMDELMKERDPRERQDEEVASVGDDNYDDSDDFESGDEEYYEYDDDDDSDD